MSETPAAPSAVRTSRDTWIVLAFAFALSTAAILGAFGPYRTYRGQTAAGRVVVSYLLPLTAVIIATLIASLQRRRLPAQDNGRADAAIQSIVFWVAVFLTGTHAMLIAVLVSARWVEPWASRAVVLLLGIAVMATGNLLPRTRPNMALGIRTTRTLADRQLWMLTHRITGYAGVAVGAVTIFASLFLHGDQVAAVPALAMAAAAASVCGYYWRAARRPAESRTV